MRLSFRGRRTVTAGMAVAIAAVGVFTGACSPAPTSKTISGTIQGADGNIVNVLMGFAVQDAAGHMLNLGSPGSGYSLIRRINGCVGNAGAATSQVCSDTHQSTTKNWSLTVPANAVKVFIELYPKAPDGITDVTTYSTSYRPALLLGSSRSNVSLVLPKQCSAGGTTGTLAGHISGWPSGKTGAIHAFSLAADQPTMGFATGSIKADGTYTLKGLQSGQRYGLMASGPGYSKNLVDYRRSTSNDTLIASRCQVKTFNF
jgi:hypothetical protein